MTPALRWVNVGDGTPREGSQTRENKYRTVPLVFYSSAAEAQRQTPGGWLPRAGRGRGAEFPLRSGCWGWAVGAAARRSERNKHHRPDHLEMGKMVSDAMCVSL